MTFTGFSAQTKMSAVGSIVPIVSIGERGDGKILIFTQLVFFNRVQLVNQIVRRWGKSI